MYKFQVAIVVLSTIFANCFSSNDLITSDLVNTQVQRTVDLTTHLPKVSTSLSVENVGTSSINAFLYAAEIGHGNQLAYITAVVKGTDEDISLAVDESPVSGKEGRFFRITLKKALGAGKKVNLVVETAYSHSLRPYPSKIAQADKQYMEFTSSLYFYSPYKTTSHTTIVNCATANIESYTKTQPVKVSDSTITYGPHSDVAPFTQNSITVHYENNSPFLTVTNLNRLIEVSHWGNVAVEETVDIRHTGAQLKGSFSRYDYQRAQDGLASVKNFKTLLPAAARDVYYRDEIGNISTSNLKEADDAVEVELRPRFPLFGGWKTHYILGYNIPSYQYLYNKDDLYLLKMRFVDHIYDDQVIDDMTIKIILPEGAHDVKFSAPFKVERASDDLHYTYLDTLGRPVIVAKATDLTEHHIQDFELRYTFQKARLLQEPLLLVGAFYLLFLVIIVYVRLDFAITKDEASESRMRVASLLEQIQGVQDRRSALYQSYDDTVEKFKSTKDAAAFSANRKKIDTDYKQLTQQIGGMLQKLKVEGAEMSEKVSELQKLDERMKDQIGQNMTHAEKLIAGKMNKASYVEQESAVAAKRDDLYQKMEALLTTL